METKIWRKKNSQKEYKKELKNWKTKCYLCEEEKKTGFENYKKYNFYSNAVFCKKNDFPYLVAKEHDLMISRNHKKEISKLSFMDLFFAKYDIVFINHDNNCTIKNHPHYHLITFMDDLSEEEKMEFVEYVENNCYLIYLKK